MGYTELHKLSLAPVMPSKETEGFSLVTELKTITVMAVEFQLRIEDGSQLSGL